MFGAVMRMERKKANHGRSPTQLRKHEKKSTGLSFGNVHPRYNLDLPARPDALTYSGGVARSTGVGRGHRSNKSNAGKRVAIIQRKRNNVIQRCEQNQGDSPSAKLPAFDGKTTHGILVLDDGTQVELVSGNGDPRYRNYRNNGHVEQKAALYMRENNKSNAKVYHNNTNGTCGFCNTMTSTFLPKGATLTVVPPADASANNSRAVDYTRTYTGTGNDPKISSKYQGN